MAKGMKIAKGNSIQVDSQIGPQLLLWANSTSTNTFTALGGVGGNPTTVAPRTIQVHFKDAAGNLYNDGFIVHQRGRKQFAVQSVAGGASTLTRVTLVQSGTLTAKQAYITFGYNGGGTQYASRITNRFVWDGNTRYQYTCGLSAEVVYIQATAGVVFYDYKTQTTAYPKTLAVVESQN